MAHLVVSFPSKLRAQIEKRVANGEFENAEQYLADLVRRDADRSQAIRMEKKLLNRLDKSRAIEMDDADFERIRERAQRRIRRFRRP